MSRFKKSVSTLMIAASLGTVTPAPKPAQAGIILTPVAVGVVLIILGIHYHNKLLIILDADGNVSQGSLEQTLSDRYSFIDNQDVISNLATAIREKASSMIEENGRKVVRLTRGEVLGILAPTGLADVNSSAVEALIQDLQ
jgi:hypothetical protein